MDEQDVEDVPLVRQQGEGFGVEGMALEAEVGAEHKKVRGMKVEG